MAAVIGWFMVVRRQSFAGHTIAVVGFPGAAGATLIGVSALDGYFAFCVAAAVLISAVPHSRGRAFSQENAVTGTVQTFLLALGFLFVSLYRGNLERHQRAALRELPGDHHHAGPHPAGGGDRRPGGPRCDQPAPAVRVHRSRCGRGPGRARPAGVAAVPRPARVGGRRGQSDHRRAPRVRPARHARRHRTAAHPRPLLGGAIAVGLGLAVTWIGLAVAYYSPYPIGFWVTTLAFARLRGRGRAHPAPAGVETSPRGTGCDRHSRRRPHGIVLGRGRGSSASRSCATPFWPGPPSRRPAVSSGTSWCCAARSSPATPSATWRSPAPWPRCPSASTPASGSSSPPSASGS